jgi:hypothetical protein
MDSSNKRVLLSSFEDVDAASTVYLESAVYEFTYKRGTHFMVYNSLAKRALEENISTEHTMFVSNAGKRFFVMNPSLADESFVKTIIVRKTEKIEEPKLPEKFSLIRENYEIPKISDERVDPLLKERNGTTLLFKEECSKPPILDEIEKELVSKEMNAHAIELFERDFEMHFPALLVIQEEIDKNCFCRNLQEYCTEDDTSYARTQLLARIDLCPELFEKASHKQETFRTALKPYLCKQSGDLQDTSGCCVHPGCILDASFHIGKVPQLDPMDPYRFTEVECPLYVPYTGTLHERISVTKQLLYERGTVHPSWFIKPDKVEEETIFWALSGSSCLNLRERMMVLTPRSAVRFKLKGEENPLITSWRGNTYNELYINSILPRGKEIIDTYQFSTKFENVGTTGNALRKALRPIMDISGGTHDEPCAGFHQRWLEHPKGWHDFTINVHTRIRRNLDVSFRTNNVESRDKYRLEHFVHYAENFGMRGCTCVRGKVTFPITSIVHISNDVDVEDPESDDSDIE